MDDKFKTPGADPLGNADLKKSIEDGTYENPFNMQANLRENHYAGAVDLTSPSGRLNTLITAFSPKLGGQVPSYPTEFLDALGLSQNDLIPLEEEKEPIDTAFKGKTAAQIMGMLSQSEKDEADKDSGSNANPMISDTDLMKYQFQAVDDKLANSMGNLKDIQVDWSEYYGKLPMIFEGANHYDLRALNQTNAEAVTNIGLRFLGTTAQAAIEPFVHLAVLPFVPFKGVRLTDVYDNKVTRGMDELNETLKMLAPVYSTKAQDDAAAFSAVNWGSAAFWDKVATGAGFTAGTLLNGLMTAGAGNLMKFGSAGKYVSTLAAQLEKVTGRGLAMSKILSNPVAVRALANGSNISKFVDGAVNATSKISGLARGVIAASAEGGVEAREMSRSLQPLIDDQIRKGEITKDEGDSIMEKAMNRLYWANTAIVGFSNYVQFGKLVFNSGARAGVQSANAMVSGYGKRGSRKVIQSALGDRVGKLVGLKGANKFTKFLNASQRYAPIVISPASEAKEELLQFVASHAVEDYYGHKDGKTFMDKLEDGFHEAFTTKEGQESMLIGALVGFPGGVVSSVKGARQRAAEQKVIDKINSDFYSEGSKIRSALGNIGKTLTFNDMKRAVRNLRNNGESNEDLVSLLEDMDLVEYASMVHDSGSLEVVQDLLKQSLLREDAEVHEEFENLSHTTLEERKELHRTISERLGELVRMKSRLTQRTPGMQAGARDALFKAFAFTENTKKEYLNLSQDIYADYEISMSEEDAEQQGIYERDKQAALDRAVDEAYANYQSGLAEGATAKPKSVFADEYLKDNEERIIDDYHDALNALTGVKAERGQFNRTAYIFSKTDEAVRNKIAERNGNGTITESSIEFADNYVSRLTDLRTSYIKAEALVRELENNQELANETYIRNTVKTAHKDVNGTFGKAVNQFERQAKKKSTTDTSKGRDLLNSIEKELQAQTTLMMDDNVNDTDKASAAVKVKLLEAYRKQVKAAMDTINRRTTKAETSTSPQRTDVTDTTEETEEETEEDIEEKPKPKPKPNVDTKKIQIVIDHGKALISDAEEMYDDVEASKAGKNASVKDSLKELATAIKNANDAVEFAEGEMAAGINTKTDATMTAVLVSEANADIEKAMKVLKKSVREYNDNAKDEDRTSTTTNSVEGTPAERLRAALKLAKEVSNKSHETGHNDDVVSHTLPNTEGDTQQDPNKGYTKAQLGVLIFGEENFVEGLLYDYIADKYSPTFADTVFRNAESVIKMLDKALVELVGEPMNASMYNYLVFQYFSLRGRPAGVNEDHLYKYEEFLALKDKEQYLFINRNSHIKYSTFSVEHNKNLKNHLIAKANFITVDRVSLQGNDTLTRALNTDVVYEGATAQIAISDFEITVNGEKTTASEILNNIREGNLDKVTLEHILELPLDINDSNGEKIGRYKTGKDFIKLVENDRLPGSEVHTADDILSRENFEIEELKNSRLRLVYALAHSDNNMVETKISHRGTGYMRNDHGKDASYAEGGRMSANIKVEGTKLLIAAGRDNVLYEQDGKVFDMSKVHNFKDVERGIQLGIPYMAIPANTTTNSQGKQETMYMVMPLQSVSLNNLKEHDPTRYEHYDNTEVTPTKKGKTIGKDKSKQLGERMKQSMVHAIGIHLKLQQAKANGVEDIRSVLTDTERTILDTLMDADYNLEDDSINGLDDYLKEFIHTYRKSPLDLGQTTSIDEILNRKLSSDEVSIVRVSNNKIEIGKVENIGVGKKHEGLATVFTAYINEDGNIEYSQYSFTRDKAAERKPKRHYISPDNADLTGSFMASAYAMLDTAYLRVNLERINSADNYSVPLLNLVSSTANTTPIDNGNKRIMLYETVANPNNPISKDGLSISDKGTMGSPYNTFMSNVLRTDVATTPLSTEADPDNYKHYFSPFAAIAIDVDGVDVSGKGFTDFENHYRTGKGVASIEGSKKVNVGDRIQTKSKTIKDSKTAETTATGNQAKIDHVLAGVQKIVNTKGSLSDVELGLFSKMLAKHLQGDTATAMSMIKAVKAEEMNHSLFGVRQASEMDKRIEENQSKRDNLDLFNQTALDLLQKTNDGVAFVEHVSDMALRKVVKNLKNAIMSTLISSNNNNKAVKDAIADQVSNWESKRDAIAESKALMEELSFGEEDEMIAALDDQIKVFDSLINNISAITDITVRQMLSSNEVRGSFKDGELVVINSEPLIPTGESSEGAYSTDVESGKEEDFDTDENTDEDVVSQEEQSEEDNKPTDTSNFDSDKLSVDYSKKASVIIKKFLSNIPIMVKDKNGEMHQLVDEFGNKEIYDYKDAYNKVLHLLVNSSDNLDNALRKLAVAGTEDPFYEIVRLNIVKELEDEHSTLPYEFAELVNKTKISLIYSWIAADNGREGRNNKIGNSNKSNVKTTIMDQWQSAFKSNLDFVDVDDRTGKITINKVALENHMADYAITGVGAINDLSKSVEQFVRDNTTGRRVNPLALQSINNHIEKYNETIASKNDNAGFRVFEHIDKVRSAEDVGVVLNKLNSALRQFVNQYTAAVGFTLTDSTIDEMIRTTGTKANNLAIESFVNGSSSSFKKALTALAGLESDFDLNVNNIEPMIRNHVADMLALESKHNAGIDAVTYKDQAGKTIYGYGQFKYMDEILSELHAIENREGENLYTQITSTAFGSSSTAYLLNDLMDRMEVINQDKSGNHANLVFQLQDAITVQTSNNKTEAIKIDQAEAGDIEVHKLFMFYNRNNSDGLFFYPTLSDGKNIASLPMTKFKTSFSGSGKDLTLSRSTIDNAFNAIIMPEINRILDAAKIHESGANVTIDGYMEGSAHFILAPYLNDLITNEFSEEGINSSPEFRKDLIAKAKVAFEKNLLAQIDNKIQEWANYGIIGKNEDGQTVVRMLDNNAVKDGTYRAKDIFKIAADFEINQMVFNTGIAQIFLGDPAAYWAGSPLATEANISKRLAGHRGPGDVGVSSTNGEVMTTSTVADIYEFSEAKTWIDSLGMESSESNIVDGQELTSLYNDMHERMSHNSVSRALMNALYHNEDAVIFKAYQRMFEDGDENYNYEATIHEELGKLTKDSDPKYGEKLQKEYLRLVNQPVKPMYFGSNMTSFQTGENETTNIRTATYIKSSSFALRPSLTKGFAIDQLRKALDYSTYQYLKDKRAYEAMSHTELIDAYNEFARRDGATEATILDTPTELLNKLTNKAREKMVDRVSFASAKKMGNNTNGSDVTDKSIFGFDGGSYVGTYNALRSSMDVIPRKGFRIQMKLPINPKKDKIKSGTQDRKLLFNGLFDSANLKGLKLRFDDLYKQLYKMGYDEFMNEFVKDGELNYEKVNEILVKEGLSRGYDNDDIAELGLATDEEGNVIGFDNHLSLHRRDKAIEPLVMSLVQNRITKIKLPGRSFVLGTEAGFYGFGKDAKLSTSVDNKSDIVFTNKWKGALRSHSFRAAKALDGEGLSRSYKAEEAITFEDLEKLNESDYYYQPDQIIIPSFFKDAKGNLINLKEQKNGEYRYINETDSGFSLKEDMFDPETLNTFGFRIPTQGHSSMASMEIVGFSDPSVGELVIAPGDFVRRMGSDFDIDKLYLYRYAIGKSEVDAEAKAKFEDAKKRLERFKDNYDVDALFESVKNAAGKYRNRFDESDFKDTIKRNLRAGILAQSEYLSQDVELDVVEDALENLNEEDLRTLNVIRYRSISDVEMGLSEDLLKVIKSAITKANVEYRDFMADDLEIAEGNQELIDEFLQILDTFKDSKLAPSKFVVARSAEGETSYSDIVNEILDIHLEVMKTPERGIQEAINSPLSYGFFKEEGKMFVENEDGEKVFAPENSNYQPNASIAEMFNDHRNERKEFTLGEFIEELYGDSTIAPSFTNSSYQSAFYEKGKMGKDGIAIFSSRSVINAVLQQGNFTGNPIKIQGIERGKIKEDKYDLELGGHTFHSADFTNNRTVDDRFSVGKVIEWYQSTAVDNAKLNKLHMLNINSATIDVVNYLNQIGFHEHTLWFINQPIIREYAKLISARDAMIGKPYSEKDPIAIIREKYGYETLKRGGSNYSYMKDTANQGFQRSMKHMADNIDNYKRFKDGIEQGVKKSSVKALAEADAATPTDAQKEEIALHDYMREQLAILDRFVDINKDPAAKFKKMAAVLNVDSKGLGADLNEAFKLKHQLFELIAENDAHFPNINEVIGDVIHMEDWIKRSAEIEDVEEYLQIGEYYIKPTTITGSAIVYGLSSLETAFKDQFIQFSPAFEAAFATLRTHQEFSKSASSEKAMLNEFVESYKRYLHSSALAGMTNIEAEYNRLLIDEIVEERDARNIKISSHVANPSLASTILEIRKTGFKRNPLIASLVATRGNNYRVADVKINSTSGVNDNDALITDAMIEMLSDNPVLLEYSENTKGPYTGRDLIRDLFIYSELTGGVQRFKELVKFVPYNLKKHIGFKDDLNNSIEERPITNVGYLTQFLQHNPKYAPRVKVGSKIKGVTKLSVAKMGDTEYVTSVKPDVKGKTMVMGLAIDPLVYGQEEGKSPKPTTFMKGSGKNAVVYAPAVVKTTYKDRAKVALYKLVYVPNTGTSDYEVMVDADGKEYMPFTKNGKLIYERVEELGDASKSEYDASVKITQKKLSAINSKSRSKYTVDSTIQYAEFLKSEDARTNVFGDLSIPFIYRSLRSIANNDGANAVTRVMADFLAKHGMLDNVKFVTSSDIKLGNVKETTFSINVTNHKNPATAITKNGITYIILNDEAKFDSVNEAQNALVHEVIHAVTENKGINDPVLKGIVDKFNKNGNQLLNEAIEYLQNNPQEGWIKGMDMQFIINGLRAIVNQAAEKGKYTKFVNELDSQFAMTPGEFIRKYRYLYGLINFKEFYSEMASNDQFVELMASIPAKHKTSKSILGLFVEAFTRFFNGIIKAIYKGSNRQLELDTRFNSVAKLALYDLIIAGKTRAKESMPKGMRINTFSNPLMGKFDYIEGADMADIDGGIELIEGEQAVAKSEEEVEDDPYGGIGFADETDEDVDGGDANHNMFYAEVGDVNKVLRPWAENSIGTSRVNVANISEVDSKQVDNVLKQLVKDGRIEFSCKL